MWSVVSYREVPFIAAFTVVSELLSYTVGLTIGLQKRAKDIMQAYKEVQTVRNTLESVWSAIDVKHREWFEKAREMAALVNVQPATPRTCVRQQHRDSHEADSPEEYFRRIVTIPMLDILLEQLQQRFGGLQQVAVKGHHLLPDVFLEDPLAARAAIHALANEYVQFLPRARRGLDAELDM